jgi:hypothetical protein
MFRKRLLSPSSGRNDQSLDPYYNYRQGNLWLLSWVIMDVLCFLEYTRGIAMIPNEARQTTPNKMEAFIALSVT